MKLKSLGEISPLIRFFLKEVELPCTAQKNTESETEGVAQLAEYLPTMFKFPCSTSSTVNNVAVYVCNHSMQASKVFLNYIESSRSA